MSTDVEKPRKPRPKRASQADRAARVYELKLSGATNRQIATTVGVSPTQVQRDLEFAIKDRVLAPAEAYRQMCMDRLENLFFRLQPKIMEGNPQAIGTARSIVMDMYKVAGLEQAPITNNIVMIPGTVESELAGLAQELGLNDMPIIEGAVVHDDLGG